MIDAVFFIAAGWMAVLLAVSAGLVVRAKSAPTRILALDMLSLILVALLVLYSDSEQVAFYLDAALLLAVLSFISVIAACRYHAEGKIFR